MADLRAINLIETTEDLDAVWNLILEAFSASGIDFVIYLTARNDLTSTTLKTNIAELYADTDPAQDPFLHWCCKSYDSTKTGVAYLPSHDDLPPEAQGFIKRASLIGFQTGIGIPTRIEGAPRFGGFNLGTRMDVAAFEREVLPQEEHLRVLALIAHRRMEELLPNASALAEKLTKRERDVIIALADGKTRKEAARVLNLSPNTVAEYSKSAYRKLGAKNRIEAASRLKV
jgi:DNA-binding CsgD family transcriptional regulator